jgi:hypothetical protein
MGSRTVRLKSNSRRRLRISRKPSAGAFLFWALTLGVPHLGAAQARGESDMASTEDNNTPPIPLGFRSASTLCRRPSNALEIVDALATICREFTVARAQSALAWELRSTIGLARLLCEGGERGQALEMLASVYERFTSRIFDRW